MRTIASFEAAATSSPTPPRRQPVSMTGEKKGSDLSARLGVKRSKPTAMPATASTSSKPPSTPPKAAIATSKPKKEEIQRRKNYFNDMLNHRSSKEREPRRSTSSRRAGAGEDATSKRGSSGEGWNGEGSNDDHAAERIAELERALAAVREEQNAMREELAKVKEQGEANHIGSTVDSRRSPRQSHPLQSPIRGAFHTDSRPTTPSPNSRSVPIDVDEAGLSPRQIRTPRRSFNSHHHPHRDDLAAENYDLRAQVAQLQDQIQSHELAYQSRLRSEADWYELTSRLHATEKESQERLQQLLSLKSSISSLTRMESQITDSELTESLSQLANRVREWVITNFRRAKVNLNNLPSDVLRALEAISPTYHQIEDRLALYQALISNALMHIFREPVLIGLPEHGPLALVRQVANHIYDASPEYRAWRRCTIRSIEKREGNALLREKEKLMHHLAREIGHQLYVLTSTNLTQNAQSTLEGILNTAADIQHTLLLQKAHYRVLFFRNQDGEDIWFDDSRMINDFDGGVDDEGDVVLDRKFAFCVFPCLEKYGDEYGENTAVRNVLLRARVCCSPG
ncbi:hypothetical protein CC80DRAFT_496376 [Byssothecium circinans]|uniref:Uncharacterized protein n=1 Tax=Byssothecium circinans TaxID=147558 RepID=A0A6A5TE89_9PLEO|nr:hypothetical protein CC80DRAFT_496376 [Byssothecium circinans]